MPHLNSLVNWLWAIETISTLALAGFMVLSGYCRRWFPLFAYLSLMAAQSVLCFIAQAIESDALYFYGYWSLEFLVDAAMVWMIVQIALRVAGITPWLRSTLVHGVVVFTVAMLVMTTWISFTDPMQGYQRIVYTVQHLEVAIDLSLCATTTLLVWVTKGAGVQWTGGVRGVTAGILLEVLASEIVNSLYLRYPVAGINVIKSVIFLAAILLWSVSVVRWNAGRPSRPVRLPVSAVA